VDDVEKLMAGEKADMIFTDPPYNVAYEGGTGLTIQNDSMGDDAFYKFLYDAYTNMLMHTKPGGAIYVAHADSEGANFRLAMKKAGWLLKQCIIWNKSSLVMGRQDYHWKHEPISTVGRRGLGTIGTQTESRQPWWSLINPPETASTRR
jgi:DNA modification methylase